jgi:hypothetical protein
VATFGKLEGRFKNSSYVLRERADAPRWCHIQNLEEPFQIGVYLPSIDSSTGAKAYVPDQTLLLFRSYVVVARSASPNAHHLSLVKIAFIESGRLLCERWFSINTGNSTYRFPYMARNEANIEMFLYALRDRLMPARAEVGLARGLSCGATLELKFVCAENDELDPEESVLIRFFSPHLRAVKWHHWFLNRESWLPADYLGLTTRRLLWLSDLHNGTAATGGVIARYCSIERAQRIRMEHGTNGWELYLPFASTSSWRIPLAKGLAEPACQFIEMLRARGKFLRHRGDEYQPDSLKKLA